MKCVLFTNLWAIPAVVSAAGYRVVGSSGCTPQMVFMPPHTDTVVFIDNYHANYGGPGYNISTGTQSTTPYVHANGVPVFGTEYSLSTNAIRALNTASNTFCSAGSFFPNGTLVNMAGAEAKDTITEGFDKIRTYAAGALSNGGYLGDWVDQSHGLQVYRWYPSAQTLVDGSILVVGGSNVGFLVLNEASINVPTYEIIPVNGGASKEPVTLPILEFTAAQNLVPGKSYNLYPMLYLLPNTGVANQVFTVAGNQTIIWDYSADKLIKTLPDTPLQARTFPSSATSVLLPLKYPNYTATVLVCGGSSGDMPNPLALNDCWSINPGDATPEWIADDDLPNGPQTMSDGILLPDGTVLFVNGARVGSGGGFQADVPVLTPLIYNSSAAAGSRFTSMPKTTIPRLYHSVAILLPTGEVLIGGSNPSVLYSATGEVPIGWPSFYNNYHLCALKQQQSQTSFYPTEYRVEIFSPPYMDAPADQRPAIGSCAASITYGQLFSISVQLGQNGTVASAPTFMLVANGFHTHGQAMSQRMVQLGVVFDAPNSSLSLHAPRDASVMPPGQYMLFAVYNGIPSAAVWVQLS